MRIINIKHNYSKQFNFVRWSVHLPRESFPDVGLPSWPAFEIQAPPVHLCSI